MEHLHFENLASTQEYLIENYKGRELLVSTSRQSAGVGRTGNEWNHFENGLAFSFTLQPATPATLTPLEVGVLISDYFDNNLGLKWPNDLMSKELKKCGGIICNYINPKMIIVGVGLNLGQINSTTPFDSIFPSKNLSKEEYKSLPAKIYQCLQNSRLKNDELITKWNRLCIHLNKKVMIQNDDQKQVGLFTGIGLNGEAILDSNNSYLSGSLFILDQ